jgi:hypothetical protein
MSFPRSPPVLELVFMRQVAGLIIILFALGVIAMAGLMLSQPDSAPSILSTVESPDVWPMLAILAAVAIIGVGFAYGIGRAFLFCGAICFLLIVVYLVYSLLFPNGVIMPMLSQQG